MAGRLDESNRAARIHRRATPLMQDDTRANVEGVDSGYPYIPAPTRSTERGTPYLQAPGVHLISKPSVSLSSLSEFFGGFSPELQFPQYLDDPTPLPPGTELCKVAGQVCYASFGPKRTFNADPERYFTNIKQAAHASVL